jgi:hypothetical protein
MDSASYAPGIAGGNREDLRGPLTILEPEVTPFTSMVTKGPAPKALLVERLGDRLRSARITGTREGSSGVKGGNKAIKRQRFGVYPHRWHDTMGATDVQQLLSEHGGNATNTDEYNWARAKTVREVKRDIEASVCSGQDCQGGGDDSMLTRGIHKWLAATQTPQVPSDFVVPGAARRSGVTLLKEEDVTGATGNSVNDVLKSLKTVYGGPKEFQCLAGNDYIEQIDRFTRVNEDSSKVRYTVVDYAEDHEIEMVVKVFRSSFGSINAVPTEWNRLDATATGDPKTAFFLNMELWELLFLDELHSGDDPADAGGQTGYVKAIGALSCLSPRGNGEIYNT